MDKSGMRRPDPDDPKNHGTENHQTMHLDKNDVAPVPELQGKAKHTKEKAEPIRYYGKKPTSVGPVD